MAIVEDCRSEPGETRDFGEEIDDCCWWLFLAGNADAVRASVSALISITERLEWNGKNLNEIFVCSRSLPLSVVSSVLAPLLFCLTIFFSYFAADSILDGIFCVGWDWLLSLLVYSGREKPTAVVSSNENNKNILNLWEEIDFNFLTCCRLTLDFGWLQWRSVNELGCCDLIDVVSISVKFLLFEKVERIFLVLNFSTHNNNLNAVIVPNNSEMDMRKKKTVAAVTSDVLRLLLILSLLFGHIFINLSVPRVSTFIYDFYTLIWHCDLFADAKFQITREVFDSGQQPTHPAKDNGNENMLYRLRI